MCSTMCNSVRVDECVYMLKGMCTHMYIFSILGPWNVPWEGPYTVCIIPTIHVVCMCAHVETTNMHVYHVMQYACVHMLTCMCTLERACAYEA